MHPLQKPCEQRVRTGSSTVDKQIPQRTLVPMLERSCVSRICQRSGTESGCAWKTDPLEDATEQSFGGLEVAVDFGLVSLAAAAVSVLSLRLRKDRSFSFSILSSDVTVRVLGR